MATQRLDPPPIDLRPIDHLIDRQAALADDFDRLLHGKTPEALTQPDHDGRWSVVEIVSHLYDWELVTHDRVHRILNDEHPTLPEFDDSLWSIEHHYHDNDIAGVLGALRELRATLVDELHALPDDAWSRSAELEGTGSITLHWLIDRTTAHDDKHLEQARDILA